MPVENHIAVIDDDEMQLELLTMIIRRQRPGWQVDFVLADPAWCKRVAGRTAQVLAPYRLLLLDYQLGQLNACDLAAELPDCPQRMVVMTASSAVVDRDRLRSVGGPAVVEKPYSLDEAARLLEVCDALLGVNSVGQEQPQS